jgi:hypothetical protein
LWIGDSETVEKAWEKAAARKAKRDAAREVKAREKAEKARDEAEKVAAREAARDAVLVDVPCLFVWPWACAWRPRNLVRGAVHKFDVLDEAKVLVLQSRFCSFHWMKSKTKI